MDKNAKQELLEHIDEAKSRLKAAIIRRETEYGSITRFILYPDYSDQEMSSFLEFMNFEYESSYGMQEVYGTLWFDDGTWSERGEYDGSEWWNHVVKPQIPIRPPK